jgi:arginine decarboxylase
MRIHVASGVGRGPTETAAYDAALAAAGVHDYNLVVVSSVIPPDAAVREVDRIPELGPGGNRLTVVQGRATATDGRASAGLGWVEGRDGGAGLFYEATGRDPDAVTAAIHEGLAAGRALRDRRFGDPTVRVRTAEPVAPGATPARRGEDGLDPDVDPVVVGEPRHTCVVYVAAYGRSRPIGGDVPDEVT